MACGIEMLKESIQKTIMMQEDIFQQQVKELHRLYYTQKKLTLEKERLNIVRGDYDILRRFAAPEGSLHDSLISKDRSRVTSNVLCIKRAHDSTISKSNEVKGCSFDDRFEMELSLCIGGKVSKLKSDCNSNQLERETSCCSGSIRPGVMPLQSSSSSDVKLEISEKIFPHLQLRLSI